MKKQQTKNIIIYWKGRAMNHLCSFLQILDIKYCQMDDEDTDMEFIDRANIIIATPGIKPSHRLYRDHHTKILSELSFLWLLIQEWYLPRYKDHVCIVGITGTNGKSTTTRMTYQILTQGHKSVLWNQYIHIGGNFDKPLSGILTEIIQNKQTTENHIVVLEVSSFMLWRLQNFYFNIGVFLNIELDHQDRHGNMKDYLLAKANILTHAGKAITSMKLKSQLPKNENYIVYEKYPLENLSFLGEHNKCNAGAVHSILKCLDLNYDESLWITIEWLPHRLQILDPIDGITIIDDGISTSSYSLSTAIVTQKTPFVLICGGYDNSDDYNSLKNILTKKGPSIVVYGQIAPHIYPLAKSLWLECVMLSKLEESVLEAFSIAKKKNLTTIVFSPWAKSFDLFDNVYHRISTFDNIIKKLRK